MDDLHRDWAVEGQIPGEINHAHAPPPKLSLNAVLLAQRGLEALKKADVHSRRTLLGLDRKIPRSGRKVHRRLAIQGSSMGDEPIGWAVAEGARLDEKGPRSN